MTDSLGGKIAFVTGGASGIGEACTRELADRGALLVIAEAKTLLSAIQWEYVAAQAAEITECARHRERCGARLNMSLRRKEKSCIKTHDRTATTRQLTTRRN